MKAEEKIVPPVTLILPSGIPWLLGLSIYSVLSPSVDHFEFDVWQETLSAFYQERLGLPKAQHPIE